jgi:hypothetical protein
MFIKSLSLLLSVLGFSSAIAASVPINGTVQSKCIIQTDQPGVFGNPNAYTLTTADADGGRAVSTRVDVTLADAYYVTFTDPVEFSSSPSLPDVVSWSGETAVSAISDATGMGSYETNKIVTGNRTMYNMTATGSTWFETDVEAKMGGNKAFPGGDYTALVDVSCIAK